MAENAREAEAEAPAEVVATAPEAAAALLTGPELGAAAATALRRAGGISAGGRLAGGAAPPITPAQALALQPAAGNGATARLLGRQARPAVRRLMRRELPGKPKAIEKSPGWEALVPPDDDAVTLAQAMHAFTPDFGVRKKEPKLAGLTAYMVLGDRLYLFDSRAQLKASYAWVKDAKLMPVGYWISVGGPDQSWFRWGRKDGGSWDFQPYTYKDDEEAKKHSTDSWLSPADFARLKKDIAAIKCAVVIAAVPEGSVSATGTGAGGGGKGKKGNGAAAKGKVNRVKKALAKERDKKEKAGAGEGDKTKEGQEGKDVPPKPKTDTPKDHPDSISVIEDDKGVRIRITVEGARQDLEYREGESDAELLERIKEATERVRDEIDPSKSVAVKGGATESKIDQKPGVGGVPLPEGFQPTPGAMRANAPAYPARIISHGPGGMSGREHTVHGATVNFTMELDYAAQSFGLQDEVFNRMQPIAYKWELLDITNLDVEKLLQRIKQSKADRAKQDAGADEEASKLGQDIDKVVGEKGMETDSGIARDLARDLANTGEDTVNDLVDVVTGRAPAGYLAVVAISDVVQIGGALISSFFSLISQPLSERSIGFNNQKDQEKTYTYLLRCFAQPVVDDDMVEKLRARGKEPVIRAPSAAFIPVVVTPINKRALETNDAEQQRIDALQKAYEKPPFPYEPEDIKPQLDEARSALNDNNVELVDRQLRNIKSELDKIATWRKSKEPGGPALPDDVYLWKAMLDLQGIEIGAYEAQLIKQREDLGKVRDRYSGFGLREIKKEVRAFRPRMSFVSELNGQVYTIIANLFERTGSKEGHRRWRLVDVTSPQTQDIYNGSGKTHAEAIQACFDRFRDDSGYGRGSLAVRLPVDQLKAATHEDVLLRENPIRVRPGSDARALRRLQDLATAAEIAALVVSGPIGIGIGVVGGVAGGIVAAENMRRRAAAERLKLDFQTGMDILGVVGAVIAVGGLAAPAAARSLRAGEEAAKKAELTGKAAALGKLAKGATWIGDKLHIAGQGMMKGQWLVIAASLYHELAQIADEEAKDPSPSRQKYRAKRLEAIGRGIKSGLVQVRMMQMQANPELGWDPLKSKGAAAPKPPGTPGEGPQTRPPGAREPQPVPDAGGAGAPPAAPPPTAPPPRVARPRKPTSGADKPTIYAPSDVIHAVGGENLARTVTDSLGGRGSEPVTKRMQLVDQSLIDVLWDRVHPKKEMPKGTIGVFDPVTGQLYLNKKTFLDNIALHEFAFEGVMRQMDPKGRAALGEPVARAVGELVLRAAIDGAPTVSATTPEARTLLQRLSRALGPDVVNRALFGGELNMLTSKFAEVYGSARGNALEVALAKGDGRLAARLAGEPNPAMSNAFGELLAVATADYIAKKAGGRPKDARRAALAERIVDLVGRDLVEGALFRGRTEDLRLALQERLGPGGLTKLLELLRANDLKAASKMLGGRIVPEGLPAGTPPEKLPLPEYKGPQPEAPPAKPAEVAPLTPKEIELRGALERKADAKTMHETSLDAIAEIGNFKELRKQVAEKLLGAPDPASQALQTARRQVVDQVLNEIKRVLEERYPGVKIELSDLGTPGFASDRDITIKAKPKPGENPSTNDLIAASVEGVRAAYEILNGGKAPAGADPFAKARELTGGRKLPPDKVLDSNFYTELHEGRVKPRTPEERLAIVEDQAIVGFTERRMNMSEGEWNGYKKRLLESFKDTTGEYSGTEASINKLAEQRLRRQFREAEALFAELYPKGGPGREAMLATVQQQVLDAMKAGATPREIRALQAKIKLLEPDAYGTRAAVVGVVDQYQGAARAETRQKAWEALGSGKEPLTARETAATAAQESVASAGKMIHAAPNEGASTSQCVAVAKYLARVWEAARKAGLSMQHPLLDRTGEIIGSKQEANNQQAAMGELRRWAQDRNMLNLTDQQIRNAYVRAVKKLGIDLDVRMQRDAAIKAAMDPTAAERAGTVSEGFGGGPPKSPPKEPEGGGGGGGGAPKKPPPPPKPPKTESPAAVLGKFKDAEEVRRTVTESLRSLKTGMAEGEVPSNYRTALEALEANRNASPVNKKLVKLLPIVEKALRTPEHYGAVMAEAWERAIRNGTDINAALVEMAREGGNITKTIKKRQGLLDSDVFFEKFATGDARIIDKGAGDAHGIYTHLLQDLVVDRALRAEGRNETAIQFRRMLAEAKGKAGNDLKLGDYIWRATYDLEAPGHLNDPESLRGALRGIGFR